MTGLILLVEADAGLGAVLSEVLRHNGYEVIHVGTLMNADVDRIDSVNAVILDHDTTAAEKELAWLDALQPCEESLPIVLMGLQAPQELRRRLDTLGADVEAERAVLDARLRELAKRIDETFART